jgi:hypothetical protein
MLNIAMNPDNNNPQTGASNLQKLEEDLQNLTKEAASTTQPAVAAPVAPLQEQPVAVPPPPTTAPFQPVEMPPVPTNIPVDNGKKGISVMTIAMVLLIIAVVVAVGYMAYTKFMVPTTPSVQTTVPTELPTIIPALDVTANWQVFNNSEWGITFKYPSTWSKLTNQGGEFLSIDPDTKITLRLDNSSIPSILETSAFSTTIGQQIGDASESAKIADITAGGNPAVLISLDHTHDTQDVPSYSYVYIVKNGKSFTSFDFSVDDPDSMTKILNNKNVFDQILSTLQFANATPSASSTPSATITP